MDSHMIDNASSDATATTLIDYGSSLNNNNGPDIATNVIQPEHFNNNYNNDFSNVLPVFHTTSNPSIARYNAIIDNPPDNNGHSFGIHNDNGLDRFYSSATSVNQPGQPVNHSLHTNTQFVSSPPINPSNDGSPSNISNNNTGFDIIYNAINLTQPGQSVPYDQYSLHTNTSMAQYNAPQLVSPPINPSNNGSPSDISNNNINNGFDVIYNATNVTQSGQLVPYDNTTTSAARHYNVVTDSSQSVSPILSQTQTNDSRIFRLMIPGFQIIVIPNNNA